MAEIKVERKIPLFAVLKNNTILKNIYLISTPPPIEGETRGFELDDQGEQGDVEETLLVGRHPDCDIRLEHPSISRFHLRIHSKAYSNYFTVTDLGSVHGTWVSGRRIEPRLKTKMNEGDMLRIGGSTRIYRLHWIPLSQAYDFENPFVPPLDLPGLDDEQDKEISKDEACDEFHNENMQSAGNALDSSQLENSEMPSMISLSLSEDNNPSSLSDEETGEQESKSKSLESVDSAPTKSLFPGMTSESFSEDDFSSAPLEDTEVMVSNENERRGELVPKNKDEQWVDSGLDVLESLFLEEVSAWQVDKEVSAPPPTPEAADAPSYVIVDPMDSAFESLRSIFPDIGPESLTVNKVQIETDEIFEQQLLDVDTSSMSSILHGLENLFVEEDPENLENQSQSSLLELDSLLPSGFEIEEKEQVIEQLVPDEELVEKLSNVNQLRENGLEVFPETEEGPFEYDGEAPEPVFHFEELSEMEIEEKLPPNLPTDLVQHVEDTVTCPKGIEAEIPLREDGLEAFFETGERQFQHDREAPEPVPSVEKSSEMEIQEKLPSSLAAAPDLMQNVSICLKSIETEANMLQNDENHSTASEPWSFWSAALAAASLKLSPPISGILLEAEKFWVQRDSRDMTADRSLMEKADEQNEIWSFWSKTLDAEEPVCPSSGVEVLSESDNELVSKTGQTLESPIALEIAGETSVLDDVPLATPANRSNSCSIWSRRGHQDSAIQVQTSRSQQSVKKTTSEGKQKYSKTLFSELGSDNEEMLTPNKENYTPNTHASMRKLSFMKELQQSYSTSKSQFLKMASEGKQKYSKTLFSELGSDNEEMFTPNKENYTPNTHASMRKLSLMKELQQSYSTSKSQLLKMASSTDTSSGNGMSFSSNKENRTPEVLGEKKSASCISGSRRRKLLSKAATVRERMPFQSLLESSPQNSLTQTQKTSSSTLTGSFAYHVEPQMNILKQKEESRRRWYMVVDTTCLLNKESRKALQLLEGLRGTQLVIPRIVVRELDGMNRQATFFRRKTQVSAALAWIEECMEKSNWWIYIQSSTEEGSSTAPTPPATPQSLVSGGISGPAFGLLPEVVTPMTEDHVLDYALYFRRLKNDGRLVLLTNDIALKIKAMAEGLVCEAAVEFRESLLNPFSDKFLWVDSLPRGRTWTVLDDIVLRQTFYPSYQELACKAEKMKGLKLILINNSQQRHACSVC
ncbi:hypothetical protein Droror1_Dr00000754 [Drosera rotundifolia]